MQLDVFLRTGDRMVHDFGNHDGTGFWRGVWQAESAGGKRGVVRANRGDDAANGNTLLGCTVVGTGAQPSEVARSVSLREPDFTAVGTVEGEARWRAVAELTLIQHSEAIGGNRRVVGDAELLEVVV